MPVQIDPAKGADMRKVLALGLVLVCGLATASQADTVKVDFVTWKEPNEGAFTIRVPAGWKTTGGIRRRTPLDIRSAVNIVSPDGSIRLFLGDYDVAPAREPDVLTRQVGWREGQVYDGTLLARYQNGVEFARRYSAWKLCQKPTITQSGILRKETDALDAQVARYGRGMATAATASVGEVIFRCGAAEGFVMAATLHLRPANGPGVSGWAVHQLAGFVVRDPAQGFFAKYLLSATLASLQIDADWERKSTQAGGEYARSMMQMSNAIAQSVTQHARQQAAAASAGGWNHPNTGDVPKIKRDPAVERRRDEANRGSRHVCDELGTCTTVDNSWSHVWRDHNNNVVPGSASGYPPDYSGQWTEMK
jgi:hypothetical protein